MAPLPTHAELKAKASVQLGRCGDNVQVSKVTKLGLGTRSTCTKCGFQATRLVKGRFNSYAWPPLGHECKVRYVSP
jgi:hypothetical protein